MVSPASEPSRTATIITCDPAPGFSPGIGRYVSQMAETRGALLDAADKLTAEQLSWHPNEDTESIGTQLLHVAAVEWSWVFEEILRRPSDEYDGWEEALPIRLGLPQVRGRDLPTYLERLEGVRTLVLEALRGLTDDDLPRLVASASPSEEEQYTIDWVLFHLVHHEAHHAGQVELLRRLLPEDV